MFGVCVYVTADGVCEQRMLQFMKACVRARGQLTSEYD